MTALAGLEKTDVILRGKSVPEELLVEQRKVIWDRIEHGEGAEGK